MKGTEQRILITGGAGFVGSSLALLLKSKYPNYHIICLDNLKRRGSELNVSRLVSKGIQFIHGDIRNPEDLASVGDGVTTVIEASAEPSVLAGINGTPDYLINTNLVGTINCMNFAVKSKASFIFLSTSRVYPIAAIEQINFEEQNTRFNISKAQSLTGISPEGLAENFPLDGYRSLYGATKLASELLIQEYNQFYGMKSIINRCGVIAGPWQMGKVDQGVTALWVAAHLWKRNLSYVGYGGHGKQVRDVLHVDDLFDLIDIQIHNIEKHNGQIYNAGGGLGNSVSLQELTAICNRTTGNIISIANVPETRTADIRIYITDNARVTAATGWTPKRSVETIVSDVCDWMKQHEESLKQVLTI